MENIWQFVISFFSGVLVALVGAFIIENIRKRGGITVTCHLRDTPKLRYGIFRDDSGGLQIHVPVFIEVFNHTEKPKILRDVSASLFFRGKRTKELNKVDAIRGEDPVTGVFEEYIGGKSNSFSLSVDGNCMESRFFFFVSLISREEAASSFDQVKVEYKDEKGVKRSICASTFSDSIQLGVPIHLNDANATPQETHFR